jgi:hypothetical protein
MIVTTHWTSPKRERCAAAESLNQMLNPSLACVQQPPDDDIVLYAVGSIMVVRTTVARKPQLERCRQCLYPRRLPQRFPDNLVENPLADRVASAKQEKCTLVK